MLGKSRYEASCEAPDYPNTRASNTDNKERKEGKANLKMNKYQKIAFFTICGHKILGVYRISGQPDNPAPDLRFIRYPVPAGSMKNPVNRPDFLNFQVLRYSSGFWSTF